MRYEIILFDVDDTLLDFGMAEKAALHNAFSSFELPSGLTDYADSYRTISKGLWNELEQGRLTLEELGVERFRRLFLMYKQKIHAAEFNQIYLDFLGKEIHLIAGAAELCDQLDGCRLAIITNGYKDVQTARIGGSPFCDMFEHLITSEEAGFQKPDQGIFDYAFAKLAISDKTKVLIVGDSLTSDIQGGINYGIDTCWFNPHRKENKLGIKPTYEIHELTDLIQVVGR